MKTLVTGASGMLGSAVMRELRARREKEYVGWSRSVAKSPQRDVYWKVDIADYDCVWKLLRLNRPEVIIHCAALTDADFCEENQTASRMVNAFAPGELAKAAKELGARFVHVSTDAVYDDSRPGTRREIGAVAPRSVYARTKLEGEGRVLAAYPEALVVRTTMFGWTLKTAPRPKFAEEILAALTNRREIKLWKDAIFSPLYVGTLAECLLDLAELDVSGVLNVGARAPISKSNFGYFIAEKFGLDPSFIEEVKVEETPLRAARPKNVGLDVSLAKKLLGQMPEVADELDVLYKEAFDGTAKKIRSREAYP